MELSPMPSSRTRLSYLVRVYGRLGSQSPRIPKYPTCSLCVILTTESEIGSKMNSAPHSCTFSFLSFLSSPKVEF